MLACPLQERIHDKFVEELTARVAALRLGNGLEVGTTQGPLISAAAVDRVGWGTGGTSGGLGWVPWRR